MSSSGIPFKISLCATWVGTNGSSISIDFDARMVSRVKICGMLPKSFVK
jgi:hypothetical protein